MTIKKHLLIIIGVVILLVIIVNSFISTSFIDRLFEGYLEESYSNKINEIIDYSKKMITDEDFRESEKYEVDNFVSEPISQIVILDENEKVVLESRTNMRTMHGNMMNMMNDLERDVFEISYNESRIGYLVILRSGDITDTETVDLFKIALRRGTMMSGIFAIIIGIFITSLSSRYLSKDLKKTSEYAVDISENKNLDIEKSKIKEIEDIQKTLKELSIKLKLKEKIRREKADRITHEARTPITILRTNIEGIMDGVIDVDKDRLETCSKELKNLTKILENIDDVLTDEDEKKLDKEEFNLSTELEKIIRGMELQFKQKNIEIEKDIQNNIIINTDKGVIDQIIYNIITNAYKYTEKFGKVKIKLSKKDDVKLTVANSIENVNMVDLDRIFDPYFRGVNSKDMEGEGLGLYIAKTNLEKIGGSIYAEESEKEIKFTLEL